METEEIISPPSWKHRLNLPAYQHADVAHFTRTTPRAISRAVQALHPTTPEAGVAPPARATILSFLDMVQVVVILDLHRLGLSFNRVRRLHGRLRKQFNAAHPFDQATLQSQLEILLIADSDGTERTMPNIADGGTSILRERLAQFDYREDFTVRWYPRGRNSAILIDPQIAFGAPIIVGTGVPTRTIHERFNAGEELGEIEEDFGVSRAQIGAALDFEASQTSRAA